jgi:hypothetical protein
VEGDSGDESVPAETPMEESPVDETFPAESPVEEPPAEEAETEVWPEETGAEVLAQVPEGTEVVVVDANGENLPLAAEEAAEVLDSADPIWCPATVKVPVSGASGCTPSFSSFQALIDHLIANPQSVNGVIWVEKTYDSYIPSDPLNPDNPYSVFTLDGSNPDLTTMSNYTLTIKGGWNGCNPTCVGTVTTTDPSEFNARLQILNWHNDVTISDILVTGTSGGTALTVTTTGKVTLTRVKVNDNSGAGASVNNAGGSGDVAITSAEFQNNAGGRGLTVYSSGTITLSTVLANGNNGVGALLNNNSAATAKNVSLSGGTFDFNDNSGNGLEVWSKGTISLTNVMAAGNFGNGAELRNNADITSTAGITLTGTNIFSENTLNGLLAFSNGTITANNLVAIANAGMYGVQLDNTTATSAKAVTLTGFNEFKYNHIGLDVKSNGAITLSNVTATNNFAGNGVTLRNDYESYGANVTLTGTNIFNDNYNSGLAIFTKGIVTLNNIKAERNAFAGGTPLGYGVYIENHNASAARAVVIGGVNEINGNALTGLYILSRGAVTLTRITAASNGGDGVFMQNTAGGTAVPQNIVLNGPNQFMNNLANGLYISTYGSITSAYLTASGNDGYGAYLVNNAGTLARNIALNKTNVFTGNDLTGLKIETRGTITIYNITASENGEYGAFLDNRFPGNTAPQAVTLSGINAFSGNGFSGLEVATYGTVTMTSVSANNNGQDHVAGKGYGVFVDNYQTNATYQKPVTLTGTNTFSGNYETGLLIDSFGVITVSGVTSTDNGAGLSGYGAYLHNDHIGSVGSITLKGTNWFSGNAWNGLYVRSNGTIVLYSVTSMDNAVAGPPGNTWEVVVDNNGSLAGKAVTITGVNKISGKQGLYVVSRGAITVSNLTASDNTEGLGAYLKNLASGYASPQNITLSGVNTFSNNWLTGLLAESYGVITLTNVTASNNGVSGTEGYGVFADNYHPDSLYARGVTLSGVSAFNGNFNDGLYVESLGAIKINSITAKSNNGCGAFIRNQWGGLSNGGIALTGTNLFEGNGLYGLYAASHGSITLYSITAKGNNSGGAYVYADGLLLPQKVTVSGTNVFNENGDFLALTGIGLQVFADGLITISNVTASWNAGIGAYLDTDTYSTAASGITMTGVNSFIENNDDGLYFAASGNVSLTKVTSDGNGGDGIEGYSDGNITLACGSLNRNQNYGWNLWAPPGKVVTLKGVFAFGNMVGNSYLAGDPPVTVRGCQ